MRVAKRAFSRLAKPICTVCSCIKIGILQQARRHNRRHRDVAAGRQNDIGFKALDLVKRLRQSDGNAELVGDVFGRKIAAQFARRNRHERNARAFDQLALQTFVRADIKELRAGRHFAQRLDNGERGRNVARRAAAGH